MKIDKFNFFRSYFDGIKMLQKDQQLEAYNQIFEYVFDDVIPLKKNIAFAFIEHHLRATKDTINQGSSEESNKKIRGLK